MQIKVIDGSLGEGGGQILRSSLSYAAVKQIPITITNIRARRPTPGLMPQHLESVKAVQQIVQGEVQGASLGSETITFFPNELEGGDYSFRVRTAGSITLIIQTILPILASCKRTSRIQLSGGTDVRWAPSIDYVRFVILPFLKLFGIKASIELVRRGHYPKGGGEVRLEVTGRTRFVPINAPRQAEAVIIKGNSHCVRLPAHVADRQAESAIAYLRGKILNEIPVEVWREHSHKGAYLGPGSGITVWAELEGGYIVGSDALGAPKVPAEGVGREAAARLATELEKNVPVDVHLADHLISLAPIVPGKTTFLTGSLSSHSTTLLCLMRILSGRALTATSLGETVLVEVFP